MQFVKEKIKTITNKLKGLQEQTVEVLDFDYIYVPEYKKTNTPPAPDAGWKPYEKGIRLGGVDEHYWLKFHIDPVEQNEGKELRLYVTTGREGMWDATNPQGIVYLNGVTTQGLDTNHYWVSLEYDKTYDVAIYYYTGMGKDCLCDIRIELKECDLKVERLYYDLCVPGEVLAVLPKEDHNHTLICNSLDRTVMLVDLRHPYSKEFYESIDKATQYIREEFYGKICGKSDITANCIGHTHIDIAWFWTVMQTKEKAQRSFSTVINLMKKYDNYIFMSSQPQLYQYVKENDPLLYEEIKRRVAEGRWEVEGAMWLEPDVNLSSGESLIRQIYHGRKFMREEFGVESRILWLPDTFGFSASLPQILRKSGIDRFFTTKMIWNETNKMPHDLFLWQGIDGTEIFTSLDFGNDYKIKPSLVREACKGFKDKGITDQRLLFYGWGDGGGGPAPDQLEYQKRMEYGIPGLPKFEVQTINGYFDKVEIDFEKYTREHKEVPKWVGELYLELHRGTYTTMAVNKKNNRRTEGNVMEAETLSVWDMLINDGRYPQKEINDCLSVMMLNQFHDILPGSAIKEVYDVTDREYAEILAKTDAIIDGKLSELAKKIRTEGGILVYNPTPFAVSDIVAVDNAAYYAENVPAHGWKVVTDTTACDDTGILISDRCIENHLIRVTLNEKYEILSVYDKELDREVIENGHAANVIKAYEDYPYDHDAWEISEYYRQKVWCVDDVTAVTQVADGIKVTRGYGNSTMEQIIRLHKNTKRIDFVTTIDWHEDHVLLRAEFPVDIHANYATYDIQFGHIQRPTHKNTSWDAGKFEVCGHKWADLSEHNYGVSLLTDCKYGYNVDENVMGISLLKAATSPNPVADRGVHTFTYSMYPHTGDFRAGGTMEQSYLLNMPLKAVKIGPNKGILPDCYSMISADQTNVVIETIKRCEEGNDIIVRMYESFDCKETVTVTTGFEFKAVYLCDLMENNLEKLAHHGRSVSFRVHNFEIVTLKFER